jgi:hypothetical protein
MSAICLYDTSLSWPQSHYTGQTIYDFVGYLCFMCVQQAANQRLQQMAWNQAPSNPTSKPDSDSVADCGKAELLKLTPKIPQNPKWVGST